MCFTAESGQARRRIGAAAPGRGVSNPAFPPRLLPLSARAPRSDLPGAASTPLGRGHAPGSASARLRGPRAGRPQRYPGMACLERGDSSTSCDFASWYAWPPLYADRVRGGRRRRQVFAVLTLDK